MSRLKDILKVIAEHRVARGWTEYQLAEHAGLPQSTISSWYRKKMIPTVSSLEKICAAFGITLSQLFAEEGMPCVFDKIAVYLIGPLVPLDRGTAEYNI